MTLYWLAGILEAEGSFLAGPPSSPNCPAIRLPMTDRDVVERVAAIFDRAVVPTRARRSHHKPAFVTTIKGAGAAATMRALAPLLGQRRQAQIERATARHAINPRWRVAPRSCDVEGCSDMVKTKGLCKRHYDHWWKTTKRGRVPRVTPQHAHLATDGAALSWEAADEAMRIGWLAGLLEGEATFRAARYGTVYSPRVQLPMTDRDVLEKAMTLMPGARIYERKDPRAITRGWRQSWIVAVNGECAAAVMSSVRPWMGTRRGSQIDRALGLWNPIRLRHPPPTCVVEGCGKPHESRGLCHKHYMSWSRDRKKGRVPRVTPLR